MSEWFVLLPVAFRVLTAFRGKVVALADLDREEPLERGELKATPEFRDSLVCLELRADLDLS